MRHRAALLVSSVLALAPAVADAGGGVTVTEVRGDVRTRPAKEKSYAPVAKGAPLAEGTRLKTGDDGEATLKFPDGSESKVRPKSEIVVRLPGEGEKQPSAVVLFFGRLWSKVAKASGGETTFEVRSANAVAGVRGTQFEVGVADDGATRVIVTEGAVGVGGDDEKGATNIAAGYEIEANGEGDLGDRRKAASDPDWAGWFSKRARELEKNGLRVAKDLDGRLNQRKAKVEKLVAEQKRLRQEIEALEKRKTAGASVDGDLKAKLDQLEKVTARLEDMKLRLEGAFGTFERWGLLAKKGAIEGGGEVGRIADEVAKIAADFADMIEEGTDMSEEGMDDMMKEMQDVKGAKGKARPKTNAKDELF